MWQVSWQHPSRCSSHWKQQLEEEGEEEPGLAAGRPLSTGSEPQRTSSSALIWCSLESRQIGLQQSVWWECGGWTLSREKKPSPLWMNLHLSPPSPVLILVRGRIFFPSSKEMKECPTFDTSWVGWTLQSDLHKILIPKHQSLFLTGKNPKNSWKNCQRAMGLILSTAFG